MIRLNDRKASKKKLWIEIDNCGDTINWSDHDESYSIVNNHKTGKMTEVYNFEFYAILTIANEHAYLRDISGNSEFLMNPTDFVKCVNFGRKNQHGFKTHLDFTIEGNFFFDFSGRHITIKPVIKDKI